MTQIKRYEFDQKKKQEQRFSESVLCQQQYCNVHGKEKSVLLQEHYTKYKKCSAGTQQEFYK